MSLIIKLTFEVDLCPVVVVLWCDGALGEMMNNQLGPCFGVSDNEINL
jgi:hypothetical protein